MKIVYDCNKRIETEALRLPFFITNILSFILIFITNVLSLCHINDLLQHEGIRVP